MQGKPLTRTWPKRFHGEMATSPVLAEVRRLCRSGEAQSIRRNADVSLAEVAADVGVTPTAVQRWETGQRFPRDPGAANYLLVLRRLKRVTGQ